MYLYIIQFEISGIICNTRQYLFIESLLSAMFLFQSSLQLIKINPKKGTNIQLLCFFLILVWFSMLHGALHIIIGTFIISQTLNDTTFFYIGWLFRVWRAHITERCLSVSYLESLILVFSHPLCFSSFYPEEIQWRQLAQC